MTRLLVVLALVLSGLLLAPPADAAGDGCRRTLPSYPDLVPGDQGRAVRTLQCTLNDLDLDVGPIVVDGDFGPQTQAAMAEIESTYEGVVEPPGRVEAGTWVLLFGRQLRRLPHLGDQGHDVKVLQRALRAAHFRIVVDGDYGEQTRRVVKAYREQFGNVRFCLVNGCADNTGQ